MATKNQINDLIKKMQHCPVCGATLTWFGTAGGEFKKCPDGCGVMKVHGKRQGQVAGLLFEVAVEE